MAASAVCLLAWLAQTAAPAAAPVPPPAAAAPAPAAPAPVAPAPAAPAVAVPKPAAPMLIRDVRCPEKVDKAACSKLTSVLVSVAETSTVRKKLRAALAGTALSVDIQEDSVDLTAAVAPDKLSAVIDVPLRLQWQPESAAFVAAGARARGLYEGLQELLAVLAPELALHGLTAFERAGAVTLLIRSGGSLVQLAVDRQGKRLFLGTAAGARPGAVEGVTRRQNPY